MKRPYTKPVLIIESYQLDMNIASCSGDGKQPIGLTQDTCTYNHGGPVYFSDNCPDDIVNPIEPGDGFCYHGFNAGFGDIFFAS